MGTVRVNSITINSTSGSAGYGPFYRNRTITSVDLGGVPWTSNRLTCTFYECTNLSSITNIPNSIDTLDYTFFDCAFTDTPTLPSSIINLPSAFQRCSKLINIVIPNTVVNLGVNTQSGVGTFAQCEKLINGPTIPDSVRDMHSTFSHCTNLVNAPDMSGAANITYMGWTFYNCSNLTGNICIKSPKITSAYQCFGSTSAIKNVYIPFTYTNGVNTTTYNSFISAGYTTTGAMNGVYLKDLATL